MCLAGAVMAASVLSRELRPGVDRLGSDNVMMISTCPRSRAMRWMARFPAERS